ncbi:uncharacterized protein F5891DRAFT_743323 [Suillus fuscotomentosus]|uniref:Fungal-type protein kinase domain-containing protein n=1 Tax=Suillus fuscotomentosus TaxID=1912939 RepID=A0AAD4DVW1_9AGAM|nr:uncharacterized protein F5891DRAFT_743323 [Suillus fuscotomentosus]KAG1893854.1 hypothetical protein F5891DRAFT_743323 [Suillus fuscotomentosus]
MPCPWDPYSTVDMICQQNHMPMHQTHQTKKSTRKPDLTILSLNNACALFQDEKRGKKDKQTGTQKNDEKDDEQRNTKLKAHMDTSATAKPNNHLWKDVLACIEFKRKTPGMTKGIKPPLSTYTVTDHVPTNSEYLPVDHLKAEVPTPGPLQTPATQLVSDAAPVRSSGLTAAQPSPGGSSSKRKITDTLESAAKKSKMNPDDTDADLDVTIQTGLYAAEIFAPNLGVNYFLNIIVVDDVIWIWYYDRQGIVQCSGIQDLPQFMVLLYALQRFKVHDWGQNKDLIPVPVQGKRCKEFNIQDKELGTVDLLLHTSHDERVTHYGPQGRATNLVAVTSEALTNKYGNLRDGMVAKIFLGEVNRTSESEILKRVEEITKRHATVQDHVPELLWHHTFTNPASVIREVLGVPDSNTGIRVLYILLFRKLKPIMELQGKELFDVWHQCILCHLTLWKEGVCHQNISPGNLMWYWKDGKQIGVLNDYDLSSLADDPGPRGNKRTVLVPFMALDFIIREGQQGKVKHLYRHDLESFMWCFVWISLRYENGVLLPRRLRPFDEWATLDAGMTKYCFHRFRTLPACLPTKPLMWRFLVACLNVLHPEPDSSTEVDELTVTNTEESVSDIDNLLAKFTATRAWATLSSPSFSQ